MTIEEAPTPAGLSELREHIDDLDEELIRILGERMQLVHAVGVYKATHGIEPLAPDRWTQVLDRIQALAATAGVPQDLATDIFNRIHEAALEIESSIGESTKPT